MQQAVQYATDGGYRHSDCASGYFSETEVENALQSKLKEGKVERIELLVSKVEN